MSQALTHDETTRARPPGVLDWAAAVSPIGFWSIHLLFVSSFTRFTCTRPSSHWLLHLATVACALATIAAMAWSWHVVRDSHTSEADASVLGIRRFVGLLGLGIGAFNLVLILWEGTYVFFLKSCA